MLLIGLAVSVLVKSGLSKGTLMSGMPPLPDAGRWAAAGAVSPNEVYIGGRLSYLRAGEVEKQFIDNVSGAQVTGLLSRSFVMAVMVGAFFAGLSYLFSEHWYEGLESASTIGPLTAFITFTMMLSFPEYELLSEWQLVLDGKAKVADSAYAVIFRVLRHERDIPAKIQTRRKVTGPPVRGLRNFLFVSLGKYRMQISVFAFGSDLYLGWTLWRCQKPISVVLRWLVSLFRGNPEFSGLIDVEPVKALRESVHNAVRQGIEAAAAELDVSIVATFGCEIPIEECRTPWVPGPSLLHRQPTQEFL